MGKIQKDRARRKKKGKLIKGSPLTLPKDQKGKETNTRGGRPGTVL